MNREQELIREFQKNECVLQIVAWEDLVKEWDISKDKMKFAGGLVSPALDSASAIKLIKEVGGVAVSQVRFVSVKGKNYVVFKGYPGDRKILTGTRYLTNNPKVVRMAVGPEAIKASAKGGFVLSVILSVSIEVYVQIFTENSQAISTMLGTITADVLKIGLSSIAGWAAGVAAGGVAVIGGVAAGPFLIAIAVGFAAGLLLDPIDEYFGVTKALIGAYERAGVKLKEVQDEAIQGVGRLERSVTCYYVPIVCGSY